MHEIIEYLLAEGFPVKDFLPDGKVHRFEIEKGDRKAGYYIAHRNYLQRTGEEFYFVQYGSWRNGEVKTFSTLKGVMTPDDRKNLEKQLAKDKKVLEAVKLEAHETAAQEVADKWERLELQGRSPYLTKKQIDVPDLGIRFDTFNEEIYVPVRDINGRLWSLQRINRDGEKRFYPGGRIRECFHFIGDPGSVIYVAEGFATAASIHLATGGAVVCSFDAGNLPAVAVAIKKLYPDKSVVICGDDDRGKEKNIGREKAEEAAKRTFSSCVFVSGCTGSDWNDLHVEKGLEVVREQLTQVTQPVFLEQISAFDVMNEPYPDENEKTFTRKGTIANVAELIKRLHIVARYNVISKKEEILFPGKIFSIDNQANATLAHLTSWCNRVKIPTDKLRSFITAIADAHPYNPVATWIESEPWDGQSRLRNIYGTIRSKNEPLKETLMRKWLISAVAAVYEPNGVSAHGVLVLQGDQYIGKTKWFKNLCPASLGVIADGMILRPDDKDSVFQVVSKWLVELGELDATFRKSDISQLKAFITKDQDVIRRPYAESESHYARRTVFFASVNETKFLNDPTGNRRFWTVECESIDYDHCINMQQLWAEVRELYLAGENWILDSAEVTELNEHNQGFLSIDPMEEMVKYGFQWDKSGTFDRWLTATEICKKLGIDHPTPQHTRAITRVLRKLSQESRVRDGYTQFKVPEISLCSDQS